jgi:hypothetical protein
MKNNYYSYIEVEKLLTQATERLYIKEAWLSHCCVNSIQELEEDPMYYKAFKCGICGRLIQFLDNVRVTPTGCLHSDADPLLTKTNEGELDG